nr:AlpA family phage regulatory protein [Pseudomonas mendocina]
MHPWHVALLYRHNRHNQALRVAAGTFPKQIPLGPKSVAWIESEIIAWCEERIAAGRVEAA